MSRQHQAGKERGTSMTTATWALLVEAALIGGAYGYSLRKPFTGGAGTLFRVSLWGGALSLLMLSGAIAIDVPDSRGLFVALLLAGIVLVTVRTLGNIPRRAAELRAETEAVRQAPQPAQPRSGRTPDASRYTVRQTPQPAPQPAPLGGGVRAQAGARSARVRRIMAMGGDDNGN